MVRGGRGGRGRWPKVEGTMAATPAFLQPFFTLIGCLQGLSQNGQTKKRVLDATVSDH